MAYISSVGQGIPKYHMTQEQVKTLVQEIFPLPKTEMEKLLPVFDHAEIYERQLVVDENWFKETHTFEEKNHLYQKHALSYSLQAIDHCLTNEIFLEKEIPHDAIDIIFFISSTGISTPSIDAYILNERPFRNNVIRMPLWGLGCAGGAIGLARAFDWLQAHPDKNALVICCELCSLTFQKKDIKRSNIIGTALFGDGVGAVLLMGEQSPYVNIQKGIKPKVSKSSSYTKNNSIDVMGWEVTNDGLEVVFSKEIPTLVETIWKKHLLDFLKEISISDQAIASYIAHPGGKKVLMAMEDSLNINKGQLKYSYDILAKHGNMSSATVFYVLKEWMKENNPTKSNSILTALGPGFSSELLLLEWESC